MDNVTRTSYPDGTFDSVNYIYGDMVGAVTDRSGRKSYSWLRRFIEIDEREQRGERLELRLQRSE